MKLVKQLTIIVYYFCRNHLKIKSLLLKPSFNSLLGLSSSVKDMCGIVLFDLEDKQSDVLTTDTNPFSL